MKFIFLAGLLASPCLAAHTAEGPWDTWELTAETGYLKNVGSNTEIDYEIIPTQLTLRSPVILTLWKDESGPERLIVRNRFSALFEAITAGPEDYYIGLSGAPSLEYWFTNETSAFFSIGGGFGWTNSAGGPEAKGDNREALGQDFTFNWFSQLGLRHEICDNVSLLGSLYFTHHSNLGLTDPNPGIDALGFTVGCSWRF